MAPELWLQSVPNKFWWLLAASKVLICEWLTWSFIENEKEPRKIMPEFNAQSQKNSEAVLESKSELLNLLLSAGCLKWQKLGQTLPT